MTHRYLSKHEIEELWRFSPPGSAINISIALGLFAGLRIAEIHKVNRSDIKHSLRTGMFHVRKETAKYCKPRTIPVCKLFSEKLWSWYSRHYSLDVTNQRIWNCSLRTVQRKFSLYAAEIHVNFTPHDLRHTFGGLLYAECKDLSLVQAVMGHSSLKTTLIYVHIDGVLQELINSAYVNFTEIPPRIRYMCPTSPNL